LTALINLMYATERPLRQREERKVSKLHKLSKLHWFLIGAAIAGVDTVAILLSNVNGTYVLAPWELFVVWYLWFIDPKATPTR
jgi:hypothetical protein